MLRWQTIRLHDATLIQYSKTVEYGVRGKLRVQYYTMLCHFFTVVFSAFVSRDPRLNAGQDRTGQGRICCPPPASSLSAVLQHTMYEPRWCRQRGRIRLPMLNGVESQKSTRHNSAQCSLEAGRGVLREGRSLDHISSFD